MIRWFGDSTFSQTSYTRKSYDSNMENIMRFYKLLTIAILAVSPVVASQYVGVNFGPDYAYLTSQSNSGLKVGYKVGASYGYIWQSGIRTEVEFCYRQNHFSTKYVEVNDQIVSKSFRSFHSISYMANAIYDVPQLQAYGIIPYMGAGVGYCHNTDKHKLKADDKTNSDKEKDNRFAYQGIVGAKYAINENVSVGAEYHYFCGKSHGKDHSLALNLARYF